MSNKGNNYCDNQIWITDRTLQQRDIVSGTVERSKIVDEAVTVITSTVQYCSWRMTLMLDAVQSYQTQLISFRLVSHSAFVDCQFFVRLKQKLCYVNNSVRVVFWLVFDCLIRYHTKKVFPSMKWNTLMLLVIPQISWVQK